jgi:hypothetical protein
MVIWKREKNNVTVRGLVEGLLPGCGGEWSATLLPCVTKSVW